MKMITEQVIVESIECWKNRGTLGGLPRYLWLLGVDRAKFYETETGFVLVVPPTTLGWLVNSLREQWVSVTTEVSVFPTLGWWECRWDAYQIHSREERL